jgi:hypothetical protein
MDDDHHVFRYLRATYDQAIVYERTNEMANTIWGWVDSDWAADLDSRRSHTGYVCLGSAKIRSTDSVNPRAVLSRVRPRYRHLL